MIKLSISISNPYSKDYFENVFNRFGKISKNKNWEFEIYKQDQTILDIDIDTSFMGADHAGPSIVLGLFSYMISAKIYDKRHWDYEKSQWQEYTECDEKWN